LTTFSGVSFFFLVLSSIDFTAIKTAPTVDISNPPIIKNVNLVPLSQKKDSPVIIISFELDNIAVNKEEFFSLLIKELKTNNAQKKQKRNKYTKAPK